MMATLKLCDVDVYVTKESVAARTGIVNAKAMLFTYTVRQLA